MATIGEQTALAANNFKRMMPREPQKAAEMIDNIFLLGMKTGAIMSKGNKEKLRDYFKEQRKKIREAEYYQDYVESEIKAKGFYRP